MGRALSGIIGGMYALKRILLFFLLALTACSGATPKIPSIFASSTPLPPTFTPLPPTVTSLPLALSVNGEGLTSAEVNAELDRYKTAMTALGKPASDDQALQAVRADLVSQFLLAQGAAEAGFVLDAAALQQRLDTLTSQVGGADQLSAWEKNHGYDDASFKKALTRSAESAWMRDKIMSSVPTSAEQLHIRQILLYNEDVAKSYYSQLQAGASFEDLAAKVDPVTRGDIGWFPRGYLTEKAVEDAAFSLAVGAYSPIIPGDVGFHIIKLMDRQPDRKLSPDALATLQTSALNDWLAARRQKSTIVMTP
jgi:peptidyl-prolyl cis-trans isomerase C